MPCLGYNLGESFGKLHHTSTQPLIGNNNKRCLNFYSTIIAWPGDPRRARSSVCFVRGWAIPAFSMPRSFAIAELTCVFNSPAFSR